MTLTLASDQNDWLPTSSHSPRYTSVPVSIIIWQKHEQLFLNRRYMINQRSQLSVSRCVHVEPPYGPWVPASQFPIQHLLGWVDAGWHLPPSLMKVLASLSLRNSGKVTWKVRQTFKSHFAPEGEFSTSHLDQMDKRWHRGVSTA